MAVTEEAVLSMLIEGGGKVKNSDFLSEFKGAVNCSDPAEKKRNRDLFKKIVNNVAVVKEIDGVKYVVVKKKYHHLLLKEEEENQSAEIQEKNGENEEELAAHEHCSPARTAADTESPAEGAAARGETSVCESSQEAEVKGNSSENEPLTSPAAELPSPITLALQRIGDFNVKPKRALYFDIVQDSKDTKRESRPSGEALGFNKTGATHSSKPFALPLRMPPTKIEIHRLKGSDSDDPPEKNNRDADPSYDSFRHKRKPSVESTNLSSPQPRRSVKSTKHSSEEPSRESSSRPPSAVPLEQAEHEWLVKSAAGHWSQVYGMLLNDHQLAEKRDFMSGFTALHWAAKCGNSDMLSKMIDISRQRGADIDINAKTHGGYTPLHIAALHDQEFILAKLVDEYGADVNVRDNGGKRAYHYLHKGISERVRGLLGEPKAPPAQESATPAEKEDVDLFPDLSKGLHTISRLFQPHMTGHKKKHKQRPGLYSLGDDPREEREESVS